MPSIRRVQLPNLEPEEVSRILSLKKSAIVAFLDAEGYPRMVPCWFLWDGHAFHAVETEGGWLEIDAAADYETATAMIADGTITRLFDPSAILV